MTKLKIAGIALLLVFLSILRLHNYDRVPFPAHAEELLYSWSGIHLIETGIPVSWSTLDYPKENIVRDGIIGDPNNLHLPAKLYKPWLDEPPLYSLLSGAFAHWYGDDRNMVLPPSHTRIPSVLLSLVTLFLVFTTGRRFFGLRIGVLAAVVYGTSPIMIFGSRLSVPENVIAACVLLSLLLTNHYLTSPTSWIAVAFGVQTALLGLMKPTGFFLAPLAIFLALSRKRYSDIGIICLFTLLGIGAFAVYGAHYDWQLFSRIISIQGSRFAGWTGLGYIFTSPAYDIFELQDGWYIFAWLSAIFLSFQSVKTPKLKLLTLFFLYWLMVAVFSGTEQDLLPWYRYPLFPLLALFGGLGINWIINRPDYWGVAIVVGTLLSPRYFLHNAFRPTTPTIVFRLSYFFALLPSLALVIWHSPWLKRLSSGIVIGVFVLGAYFNSKYVYSAFEIGCEAVSCPFGPSTRLSETRIPFFWRWFVPGQAHGVLDNQVPWF